MVKRTAKLWALILAIVLFVVSITLVDIAVTIFGQTDVIEPYYLAMWNVAMPVFSLAMGLSYWAGASRTRKNNAIALALGLTCLVLTTLAGLVDVLYCIIRDGALPDNIRQWSWTWQYQYLGTWNTTRHLAWMSFCIFIIIPLIWICAMRVKS